MPAVIFWESTTSINGWMGQYAQLTVTVDDVDAAGTTYLWNYHLENVSVNYNLDPDGPSTGIGLFDVIAAATAVDPASVTVPSGWSVYLGDGNGDPGLVRWVSGEAGPVLLPGQAVNFGFETGAVDIVRGNLQFADPTFALPVGEFIPVPGEEPVVRVDTPTIKLQPALYPDRLDSWQEIGVSVRINDNFDESQETETDRISDYLPNPANGQHQIKANDTDLLSARASLNMTATNWTLTWTVTPKVKVWYRDWLAPIPNQWKQVSGTMEFTGIPVPKEIELRIEGIELGSGTVTVGITDRDTNTSDCHWITAKVFSLFRFTGHLAQEAISQQQDATSTKLLSVDGYVYRASESKTAEDWQLVARTGLAQLLRHRSFPVSIQAVHNKEVRIGSYALEAIDPRDIAEVGMLVHRLDINKQGAAKKRIQSGLLMHELMEQFHRQSQGIRNDYDRAHGLAEWWDSKIIANANTRTTSKPIDLGNGITRVKFTYGDGTILTLDVNQTDARNIEGCGLIYPD